MQTENPTPQALEIAQHETTPQNVHKGIPASSSDARKHPSRWKRIKQKIMALLEKLALKLLSKILRLHPSPTSSNRQL